MQAAIERVTHSWCIGGALVDPLDGQGDIASCDEQQAEVASKRHGDLALQQGYLCGIDRATWHRDVVRPLVRLQAVVCALV